MEYCADTDKKDSMSDMAATTLTLEILCIYYLCGH